MTTALAVVEPRDAVALQPSARAVGLLRPLAPPKDVLVAQNETRAMVAEALEKDRDYGTIPGTGKPTLFKPGAERLGLAFGLAPRFRVMESEIDHDRPVHWTKRTKKGIVEGDSIGLYRYVVECEILHRETGVGIASCIASCSSMESKYVDRPRDVENTLIKMAEKRAFVGAILLALGLSDEFTQDVEDLAANGAIDGDSTHDSAPKSDEPEASCPKCKGKTWDNRQNKTNPKAPDFKCRDKNCDGVFWPGQWPPKAPDATQTDAFDAGGTAEKLTRDSAYPRGQFSGTKVRDLPIDFLKWAIADGRNLGDRTADWQDLFSLELDERAVEARAAAEPTAAAKEASDAALGVTDAEKPKSREPRPESHAPRPGEDEIPF